jgi:hypothetical protein
MHIAYRQTERERERERRYGAALTEKRMGDGEAGNCIIRHRVAVKVHYLMPCSRAPQYVVDVGAGGWCWLCSRSCSWSLSLGLLVS